MTQAMQGGPSKVLEVSENSSPRRPKRLMAITSSIPIAFEEINIAL